MWPRLSPNVHGVLYAERASRASLPGRPSLVHWESLRRHATLLALTLTGFVRAHAAAFTEKFAEGYAHKLGQRGGDISTGQRQLLSFARALAYDPPVLILDEATSSVDAETEENIRRGLEELTQGRTSLIVAHRFSTLADADRLLVIRDGQLAEETTPREFLVKRSGSGRP